MAATMAAVLESVRQHCCGNPRIPKVKTPFQQFQQIQAEKDIQAGRKPDWKAIGHEWKHHAKTSSLANVLTGLYAENILETAAAIVEDMEFLTEDQMTPKREYTDGLRGVIPCGNRGKSSFRLVPAGRFRGEMNVIERVFLYLNGKEIAFYYINTFRWHTFHAVYLRDKGGMFWKIVLSPSASKLIDSYEEETPRLAIFTGHRAHAFHGRLTSEFVYTK
jgi:hypothetical protein